MTQAQQVAPSQAQQAPPEFVFSRPSTQTALGALMYFFAAPVLAFFCAAMCAALVSALLKYAGANEDIVKACTLIVAFIVFVLIILWCIRDFRRRTTFKAEIYKDRVAIGRSAHRQTIFYRDVESLKFVRKWNRIACVIKATEGPWILLPPDIVDHRAIDRAFRMWLGPIALDKFERRLASGEAIDLRWRAIYHLTTGCVSMVIGCLVLLKHLDLGPATRHFKRSVIYLRQCWRGLRGGFVVSSEGLQKRNLAGNLVRWRDINDVTEDDSGLIVHTAFEPFVASPYAHNFWVVTLYLACHHARVADGQSEVTHDRYPGAVDVREVSR